MNISLKYFDHWGILRQDSECRFEGKIPVFGDTYLKTSAQKYMFLMSNQCQINCELT